MFSYDKRTNYVDEHNERQIIASHYDTYGTYDDLYKERVKKVVSTVKIRNYEQYVREDHVILIQPTCYDDKMDCVDEVKLILNTYANILYRKNG